jgi:lysophospholipase L1-like esterase
VKCIALFLLATVMAAFPGQTNEAARERTIRYAVVGDSYSIGEGARPDESWPALLARSLTKSGIAVELVSNPARTGWTTQNAIERELPVFTAAKPDFATLQIGVNDWVQGVDAATFRARLGQLIDAMLKALSKSKRLLVVNIPDFSVTPDGPRYACGRDIAAGLTTFNRIIADEAGKRGLRVIDLFPFSQKMRDPSLIASDRLHPSAKGYAEWEQTILPIAKELLGE